MTEQSVVEIGRQAIWVAIQVGAPALFAALVAGLVVSIFQAATQINEQTLSFIPKILVMTAALFFFGPWIIQIMTNFTINIMSGIPNVTN